MKNPYLPALGLLFLGLGAARPASAQYVFTDSNLGPYSQNFDAMSGNVQLTPAGTPRLPILPGVYAAVQADAQFGGGGGSPDSICANDGGTVIGNYYHFGMPGSTDRALGGIAESGTYTGSGFVGIRLRNSSSVTIQNLEVQYAMEQWYNSGNAAAAYVNVAYRKSSGVAGENMAALANGAVGDTWTPVPALTVTAPSTGTAIQSRDGNAASNRRVAQTILSGLALAPGEEIMIRWSYVLNPNTNGNGVSIDDVVITPQFSTFSSRSSGSATWADASGTAPTSLTAPNQTYYLAGTVDAAAVAAISGANSKIIVGIPPQNGAPAEAGTLVLSDNTALNVPVDVMAGSTLRIEEGAAATPITLGTLAPASTVVYASTAALQTIRPASYGRLALEGAGPKALGGSVLLNGGLQLSNAKLVLGAFDATIVKNEGVVGADQTAYVVTNGEGRLRQSVLSNNAEVLFPVGTASRYLPAALRQSATRSEDVFAVRVSNERYSGYTTADAGVGATMATSQGVRQTWFVSEEVPGNANVSLKLQWGAADQSANFSSAQAYISHYHNSSWDRTAAAAGATAVPNATDTYTLSRSGITSFSPFAVSSDLGQPLPVELMSFTAKREGSAVNCTWATASEKNSRYFALERSLNGQEFSTLGTVAGAGTSTAPHTYTLSDPRPAAATAYYRLRQVDTDGTVTYGPVAVVKGTFSDVVALSAAPNPSTGQVTLSLSTEAATVQGSVINLLGAEVLHFTQTLTPGSQGIALDLSTQPAGVYAVRVQTPQGTKTIRVVKR